MQVGGNPFTAPMQPQTNCKHLLHLWGPQGISCKAKLWGDMQKMKDVATLGGNL